MPADDDQMKSQRDAPGTPPSIPDHELLRRIGSGSYGEVWLARNVLGSYRAVKVVHRSSFDSDRPFEREFQGIQAFEPISRTHPSQVDVLQVGRRDDFFYYVMELADPLGCGPAIDPGSYEPATLKARTATRARLPFEDCLRTGLALAEALAHLHDCGLVHRDIKPANIIFVGGVPKLADIGLVTTADATRTFVGTEGFVPPEGAGTPQSDLYALGKVLYEISTGLDRHEYPAAAPDFGQLPERLQLLELEEIIEKACAPDPRDRYANARQLHDDLSALAAGQSVRRRHRWQRWRQRGRTATKTLAWIALGAALVGAIWHQTRRASPDRGLTTQDPEAIRAYRVGVFHVQKRTWPGYTNGALELQRALAVAPNFVEAHAALAEAYAHQARFTTQPAAPFWLRARDAAQRALQLRPDPPEAQALVALAMFERDFTRDLAAAERLCLQARRAAPTDSAPPYVLSHVLSFQGRAAEGVEAARQAADLDPTSALLRANVASRLVFARRFDEALAAYQAAIQLQPNFHVPYEELAFLLLHLGREPEALAALTHSGQFGTMEPAAAESRRRALADGGAPGLFEYLLKSRREAHDAGHQGASADVARHLVSLGRVDESLTWAQLALDQHRNVFNLLTHPFYEAFQRHPGFPDFARRARLPVPESERFATPPGTP